MEPHITIGSGNQGQVAIGDHNSQVVSTVTSSALDGAPLAELRAAIADLRQRIDADVPEDLRASAAVRVDELEETLTSDEPDPSTIDEIKSWFARRLPDLAEVVMRLVLAAT